MKIKPKPMKRTLGHAMMPMFAYFGINLLVSVAYVFLLAMPKLSDMMEQNNISTMAQAQKLLDEIMVSDSVLLMMLVNFGVLIYALMSFIKSESHEFDRKYHNRIRPSDILMFTVLAVGMYHAVNIIVTIIINIISSLTTSVNDLNETVGGMMLADYGLTVFVVGILAPVMEELLVRGLIFNRLRKIGSVSFAIFTSSLIFASMHFPLMIQCIYTFAVGAVFAWAYYKYENILVPIILHIIYNMSTFVFMDSALNEFFSSSIPGLLAFYAVGVGATYIGIKYIGKKARPALMGGYSEEETEDNE